jgi:hypothetical protein
MQVALVVVASAVVATAEICANLIDGGKGNPPSCRLATSQRVETPYFSVVIDPGFLVAVDQSGRRMLVTFSQHQNQAGVSILAIPIEKRSETDRETALIIDRRARAILTCSDRLLGTTTWQLCREASSEEGDFPQYYFLETPYTLYLITHYSSELGRAVTPAIHQLLDTITVHGI